MPVCRTLIVLLACASLTWADEVKTLTGKKIAGTVTAITDQEVVVKSDGGEVKIPLVEILALELNATKAADLARYTEIVFLDESVLRCQRVNFTGNQQLELTLFTGQVVQVPLSSVVSLLHEAQNKEVRSEWEKTLAKKVKRDWMGILSKNVLNPLDGTFGDFDVKKQTIQFRFVDPEGKTRDLNRPLANVHAMSFYRTEQLKNNPACYVQDASGNMLAALKVAVDGKSYTITTVGGIVVQYQHEHLARLDYNLGKLKYLSDIEPSHLVESTGAGLVVTHKKDANLDGEPIVLDRPYAKGLSLHAYTKVEYDLGGKYKEFYAVLGVDTRVGSDSQATVTIEYDGKTVFSEVITAKAIRILPVAARDVRNVKRLRITVSSSNILDLHDHVTLADAKISQ